MGKITSNKLALRGLFAAVVGAAALSVAAPAQAYFHGHYWGGHYWGGPRVSIGIGVGSCCWGPYWAGGYYPPYYYPYPYIARPARFYDYDYDDYAYGYETTPISLNSPWVREALDAPIGDAIQWDDGALHGNVTATRDGWSGNRYCREFRQTVTIDGRARDAYGTACRNAADNGWQLVPNQR